MKILAIGLGKLGLPFAATLAAAGHTVVGYDKAKNLVDSLNSRTFQSREPGLLDLLNDNLLNLDFHYQLTKNLVKDVEVVFITVPTPSLVDGSFSNQFILESISEISPLFDKNHEKLAFCIVSTVMPGSCDGEIKSQLENFFGEKIGERIGLCYHPEFIALGSVITNLKSPDFILLGTSSNWAGEIIESVITSVLDFTVPVQKMSLLESEFVKLAINNFITLKITFANTLFQLTKKFNGVDIGAITQAIGMDSRIGSKYISAGAPFGGPCFPRDNSAMTFLFKKYNLDNQLPEIVSNLNKNYTNSLVHEILSKTESKMKVGIIGISYKPGTPVIDDSPGVFIAHALVQKGLEVRSWDDEGAVVPMRQVKQVGLDELLNSCDFFVLTRKTEEDFKITEFLKSSQKSFIDLWKNN